MSAARDVDLAMSPSKLHHIWTYPSHWRASGKQWDSLLLQHTWTTIRSHAGASVSKVDKGSGSDCLLLTEIVLISPGLDTMECAG